MPTDVVPTMFKPAKKQAAAVLLEKSDTEIQVPVMPVEFEVGHAGLGLITPEVLVRIGQIDRISEDGSTGVQRLLNRKHAQEYLDSIIRSINAGRIMTPRLVVLNADKGIELHDDTLVIQSTAEASIIDGQHLRWACEQVYALRHEAVDPYVKERYRVYLETAKILALILYGWELPEVRKAFVDINGFALKVSGAQNTFLQGETESFAGPAEQAAYDAVKLLDSEGPFKDLIKFNGIQAKGRVISVATLTKLITTYLAPTSPDRGYEETVVLWGPIVRAFPTDKKLWSAPFMEAVFRLKAELSAPGAVERIKAACGDPGLQMLFPAAASGSGAALTGVVRSIKVTLED